MGQVQGDECVWSFDAVLGSNSFDTSSATSSTPLPVESMCLDTFLEWGSINPDVWFKFTPSAGGNYTFTTCDVNSYDTSIVLYENSCLNQVACNGDDPSNNSGCQTYYSTIEFNLIAGLDYFIRIGGYQGAVGIGTLNIDPPSGGGDNIWYVDIDNTNQGAGTSWSSAFNHVQDALNIASSGDQIWVANGIYRATDTNGSNEPRDAAFRLIAGVELYGGFQGNEISIDQRNPRVYKSILTGDLFGDDDFGGDNSENSFHVIIADNLNGLPPRLDGFYVKRGNANGTSADQESGGGFRIRNYTAGSTAIPEVYQTEFILNNALKGGAVCVSGSNGGVNLFRCVLANNTAENHGGAIKSNGFCQIESCLIVSNHAVNEGGAIYIDDGVFTSYNSTVVQNFAGFVGGLYLQGTSHVIHNTIIWGNQDIYGNNLQVRLLNGQLTATYNCTQNEVLPGGTNVNANPRFVDEFGADGEPGTGDENFQLLQLSPFIDAGDSSLVHVIFDLKGNDRIVNDPYSQDTGIPSPTTGAIVDLGCYEHVVFSNDVLIWEGSSSYNFYDSANWLPLGYPNAQTNALFSSSGQHEILFDDDNQIHKLFVTEGDIKFNLNGTTLKLLSVDRPLGIDLFDNDSSATFLDGVLETTNPIELNGNITFTDMTIDVGEMFVEPRAHLSFDGLLIGNVQNNGGVVSTAGRGIGLFDISGALTNQQNDDETGQLVGSLIFDIAGNSPGITNDHMYISEYADLSCSLDLRWNEVFTPEAGQSFDIMTVASTTGQPTVIYNSGLPSFLTTRWVTPNGLRGGDEVIVETSGPIIFDAGETAAITNGTPNDIVVADLNNDSYPDIAMSISSSTGGPGSIVVLWNNGMIGNVWQGFTESSPILVGGEPLDIEVGDFNGDGSANDIVVANYNDDNVSILSNDNNGIFTKTDVSTDIGPKYIAIGEYVEDALELDDIVVGCTSFKASVLTNASSFRSRAISFTHTNSISIPSAGDIKPGDVNHDKDLDFIILDIASEEVRVLEGTGNGTTPPMFVVGNPLPNGSAPVQLSFSDVNRDGNDDAITVNEGTGSLSILLGDGNDLGNTSSFVIGASPQSMAVHDFDNDGDDDFVVSLIGNGSGERELLLIRNDTVTTIVLSEGDAFNSGVEPILVNHGDIDQDGLNDIISVTDLNPLVGVNSPALTVSFNSTAVVVECLADLDGDGVVAVGDILALISAWGDANPTLDIDGSGSVDVGDILMVVSSWGPC